MASENPILFETDNFVVHIPQEPFIDRAEGGHLIIHCRLPLRDRTLLTREQALEYMKVSMVAGEALVAGMAQRGVEVGIVNYQDMGNWGVFKPEGPRLHMHIFGRAKTATIQAYGSAVQLPFRDTGFYDSFKPLDADDIAAIQAHTKALLVSEKYQSFH